MECTQLRIARGNDFTLLVDLTRKLSSQGDSVAESIAETAYKVALLTSQGGRLSVPKAEAGMEAHNLQWSVADTGDGKAIAITVPCGAQGVGGYGLEVVGEYADGSHWRYKAKAGEAFSIVDATSEQNVPDGQARVYAIHGVVGIGALAGGGETFTQLQSDWEQDDETAVDFIKHKPSIPSLQGYATENYVSSYVNSSMIGYATRQWVLGQGFLTAHQDLTGFATEQWVLAQGFLTAHQDISNKEDKVSIHGEETGITALSAVVGTYHVVPGTVSNLAVTLPTMTAAEKLQGLAIYLKTGSSGTPDIRFTSSHDVVLPKGYAPEADTIYEFNCIFNGLAWVVAYAAFEEQT